MNLNPGWPVENLPRKYLIAIPLIIAAIFGSALVYQWNETGEPVPMSMEFAGGSFVRITNIQKPNDREAEIFRTRFQEEFGGPEPQIHRFENGMELETSKELLEIEENQTTQERMEKLLEEMGFGDDPSINIRTMGSIITQLYQQQARNAAIAALIAMAIILFIALRHPKTVGSILLVIGLDFLGILGGMTILGIELSLASMAGILLIFGYAVNTNILLSRSILKRKGKTPRKRAGDAMSTGIKMSSTSATAMIALNILTSAPELQQISAVMAIGILVDMANTWLLNSGLILSHQEEKKEEYHGKI